ncbi:hypothetical protein C6369_001370 [Rhodococcus rhodochrous]|uniref:Ltp family lipoprotein n=1 Tax=Rhodococcus rhodochrous TaxID=1829 RepID=UPI000E64CDC9|nr:Ltp family lipoprotein [Rhodococcus rhodochrous]AYA27548.1 hypothetical protein C6369_001370 [Rhodococcus rhodochrous]
MRSAGVRPRCVTSDRAHRTTPGRRSRRCRGATAASTGVVASPSPSTTKSPISSTYLAPASTPSVAVAPAVAPTRVQSQVSSGQRNAVRAAQQYIEVMAFSRSGLIDQLEYDGFSTEDARYAVDGLQVDWNRQAARSAAQYLEVMSFSLWGLIEQLEYDGYTTAQAQYGANAVY